jgi:sulfatase maturation enzyme AslB (radical SAM superfamily)
MCPVCYKRIPAQIIVKGSSAVMLKKCDEHGDFEAVVDSDASMILRNYNQTTQGINLAVLVPVTEKCNMSCPWCFMKGVETKEETAKYYDNHFRDLKEKGFAILLSGGEPTVREDFVSLVKELGDMGWPVVTMSNMIKFSDLNFMQDSGLVHGDTLWADFSMQHPKNYSGEVAAAKFGALTNLEKLGIRANCIQFSVSDLDELTWIRNFYNDTKHLYRNIRIRTLHGFWKDDSKKIYLSQLYKRFMEEFSDLMPMADNRLESTNMYSIYMRDAHCGISLSSAPTVHNIDLSSCSRPTYGVALDGKYYGFPVAQIISEGIQKGYYNGYKICEK